MPVTSTAPELHLARRPAGVMVGTPMYGGQCFDAYLLGVFSLQQECHARGIPLMLHTIRNESLIPRARNRVLHDFLASDCSHLVFVDADIGFEGRDLLRLIAHDRPIVGGTYAKKNRAEYDPAFVPLAEGARVTDNELIEVRCLPGGFLCLQRGAVERLAGAHHRDWYFDGNSGERRVLALCDPYIEPDTHQLWSEDYALCLRWRAIGGQCFLDPNILLTHNGTTVFDGDPRSVFLAKPAQSKRRRSVAQAARRK